MEHVIVIDDDRNILKTLGICLESLDLDVSLASTGETGLKIAGQKRPQFALVDLKLPGMDGIEITRELLKLNPSMLVVIITAHASIDTAVEAIKTGAYDYLPKPFTPSQIAHMITKLRNVQALHTEVESLRERLQNVRRFEDFKTKNPRMVRTLEAARKAAASTATILVTGETGTGKEVLARMIHDWSPRKGKPFITLNCATLNEELLASELFGHVRGAFTGAVQDKEGKVELASKGTLFIDEIGELPLSLQSNLLRFLQSHEYEKVGNPKTQTVDVRIVAATNRNLDEMIDEGLFREDLFFRLSVVELHLLPLRDRPEDLPILIDHFLSLYALVNNKQDLSFDSHAIQMMMNYSWTGNVRELMNVIERGVILAEGPTISAELLPPRLISSRGDSGTEWTRTLVEVERLHIEQVLRHASSQQEAAETLGIDPATLWRKRKRYDIP